MKLYAEYMKEREDINVVYNDNAFISYKKIDDTSVFVYAMYSIKETRGQGDMVEFCEKFVSDMKEDNIKVIYGTTAMNTNGWEYSDRLLKRFGFKFSGKDENDTDINHYYLDL